MKILYLGHLTDYDRTQARNVWEWLYATTGHRVLVVIHPKVPA